MGLLPAMVSVMLWAAASTPESGARAGASLEDGFGVESSDQRFSLGLGILGQMRYELEADAEGIEHGFGFRMIRPVLSASLWGRRVRARLMPELAGTPRVLDATATVELHEAFSVLLGQYRPWLSRGFRTGLNVVALPDRGAIVDAFRIDRDVGATVFGRPAGGRFEYYVGVMNGAGSGSTSIDAEPLYTARMVVAPLGPVGYTQTPYLQDARGPRVAVGASTHAVTTSVPEPERPDPGEPTGTRERQEVGASADLVVYGGRVSGQLEGFWRHRVERDSTRRGWGTYGQLAAEIVRKRLDVAVRAGAFDDGTTGLRVPVEGGVNVYLAGHHAKLQVGYASTLDPHAVGAIEHGMTLQFQLWM